MKIIRPSVFLSHLNPALTRVNQTAVMPQRGINTLLQGVGGAVRSVYPSLINRHVSQSPASLYFTLPAATASAVGQFQQILSLRNRVEAYQHFLYGANQLVNCVSSMRQGQVQGSEHYKSDAFQLWQVEPSRGEPSRLPFNTVAPYFSGLPTHFGVNFQENYPAMMAVAASQLNLSLGYLGTLQHQMMEMGGGLPIPAMGGQSRGFFPLIPVMEHLQQGVMARTLPPLSGSEQPDRGSHPASLLENCYFQPLGVPPQVSSVAGVPFTDPEQLPGWEPYTRHIQYFLPPGSQPITQHYQSVPHPPPMPAALSREVDNPVNGGAADERARSERTASQQVKGSAEGEGYAARNEVTESSGRDMPERPESKEKKQAAGNRVTARNKGSLLNKASWESRDQWKQQRYEQTLSYLQQCLQGDAQRPIVAGIVTGKNEEANKELFSCLGTMLANINNDSMQDCDPEKIPRERYRKFLSLFRKAERLLAAMRASNDNSALETAFFRHANELLSVVAASLFDAPPYDFYTNLVQALKKDETTLLDGASGSSLYP